VAAAPVTTRVGPLSAPGSTVISIAPAAKAVVGAAVAGVTPSSTPADAPEGAAGATATTDPSVAAQLSPTTTAAGPLPAGVTSTTVSGETSTTVPTSTTIAVSIPAVAVSSTATVKTVAVLGKNITLTGEITLTGSGSPSTKSYSAVAVVTTQVRTGSNPDDLVMTFKVGSSEFSLRARGTLAADNGSFTITTGVFSAHAKLLNDLGLASDGSASGTVGLSSGGQTELTLKPS
jgi:hypothetical protein